MLTKTPGEAGAEDIYRSDRSQAVWKEHVRPVCENTLPVRSANIQPAEQDTLKRVTVDNAQGREASSFQLLWPCSSLQGQTERRLLVRACNRLIK